MKTVQTLLISLALLSLPLVTIAEEGVNPALPLEQQTQKVLEQLSANDGAVKNQPEALNALVNEMVLPMIDFQAMSKLTLSKNWKKASKEKRAEFVDAYKGLLARTYTKSLTDFAGQKVVYYPERTKIDENYAKVYSEFVQGGGKPNHEVRYEMRLKDGDWLVYDVVIDGLSFIKSYRTSFSKEIKDTSLDALIARLRSDDAKAAGN